jgi:hypothetical protein
LLRELAWLHSLSGWVVWSGVLLLSLGCGADKARVIPMDGERTIRVYRNRADAETRVAVLEGGREVGGFTLLHGLLERPLVFLPGAGPHQITCVYDFDVGLRLLVFDRRGSDDSTHFGNESSRASVELAEIVRGSDFVVRHGTAADLAFAVEYIKRAPTRELRQLSIPTLLPGWSTIPFRKRAWLRRLEELPQSFRGDGSRIVETGTRS